MSRVVSGDHGTLPCLCIVTSRIMIRVCICVREESRCTSGKGTLCLTNRVSAILRLGAIQGAISDVASRFPFFPFFFFFFLQCRKILTNLCCCTSSGLTKERNNCRPQRIDTRRERQYSTRTRNSFSRISHSAIENRLENRRRSSFVRAMFEMKKFDSNRRREQSPIVFLVRVIRSRDNCQLVSSREREFSRIRGKFASRELFVRGNSREGFVWSIASSGDFSVIFTSAEIFFPRCALRFVPRAPSGPVGCFTVAESQLFRRFL